MSSKYFKLAALSASFSLLAGCASVSLEQDIDRVNHEAHNFTDGQLFLARTDEERESRVQKANALLGAPLDQRNAVQLALLNSPALQAMIARGWADSVSSAQAGRIANPIFGFERLTAGDDLEISRSLSVGLLDLLTLPVKQRIAGRLIEQSQLQLTSNVVDQITQVRHAWVRAVAAEQTFKYAQQVYASAEASAELARRMEAAGNFNRISRAREQAFYADAATRLAMANHLTTSSREELVRLLGLDDAQARQLTLPDRLPDLPQQALEPEAVGTQAVQTRLDIRIAQLSFESAAKAQGLNIVTSFVDIELTGRHNTQFDSSAGARATQKGYEIDMQLPVFDWGGLRRDAMTANTLTAANQFEATVREASSSLRENYSAYRSAYDIARHYRDEIVPLRKVIAEENQYRYNGMLIGVFELLADARDQVGVVVAAIDAEQQFWLADAALQASLIGLHGQ